MASADGAGFGSTAGAGFATAGPGFPSATGARCSSAAGAGLASAGRAGFASAAGVGLASAGGVGLGFWGGVGCGRDASGAGRESMGWVGQAGSRDGGGGAPSGGVGAGSNAGLDADRMSEGASGTSGSGRRPPRRLVMRRKIDGRPGPVPSEEAAAGAGRSELGAARPGPGSAAGRGGAGPAGPAGGVGSGVGGAGGVASAGPGWAGDPLAGAGCRPWLGPFGAPTSVPRGNGPADRRGSSPRWRRSDRDPDRVEPAGRPSGRAEGSSLSELDSPADGESLAVGGVLGLVPAGAPGAAGPVARAGWADCGPDLAPGMPMAPSVPCSPPGGSGGMAVAGP
jgi:hypothetical protein